MKIIRSVHKLVVGEINTETRCLILVTLIDNEWINMLTIIKMSRYKYNSEAQNQNIHNIYSIYRRAAGMRNLNKSKQIDILQFETNIK